MSSPEPLVGRVERLVAMRSFPGWSELPTRDLVTLAAIARPRRIGVGEQVFTEGQPIQTVLLVLEGELALSRGGKRLGLYRESSGVGGLAAFARDPRGYDCLATRDSVVLELHAEDLEELFEDRFPILLAVVRELARENVELRRRLPPSAGFPTRSSAGDQCPAQALDLVERIFFLRRTLAFGAGRIDSLAELAKGAEEIRAEPGRVVWKVGDRADDALAIVCGTLRCRTEDGLAFELGAGDLAGGLDALGQVPRWYSAEVGEGLVALSMGRDLTVDVWEDHPDLALEVLQAFAAGLLALLERAADAPPPSFPTIP
ncbi:MAG: cyclic nucleotide-binding domain-containing protein [Sandaracinaceae bacterium]